MQSKCLNEMVNEVTNLLDTVEVNWESLKML